MKNSIRMMIVVAVLLFAIQNVWAEMGIGKVPKQVSLQDKLGGRLDGAAWSSTEFKNKVTILFYVDPDEENLNEHASQALDKEQFPKEKVQSFAIINMAATWMPNFAISSVLKKSQKKYPTTTYVRDYKKVLVNEWGLMDDSSDVLIFDKAGNLIFRKDGKLSDEDVKAMIKAIWGQLKA